MSKHLIFILFSFCSYCASSTEVLFNVSGPSGKGLGNIIVYAEPVQPVVSLVAPKSMAIMDQIDKQFQPHILAIQKNTLVKFPNSDSIKHHVYSFSSAKNFELQLYKDIQADPLLFSKSGVVELGCNVHDWMLGYVFVVDTPYFTKTRRNGQSKLNLPAGEYKIKIWSPLIEGEPETLVSDLTVLDKTLTHDIALKKALLPNLNEYETTDEFSDYE